MIHNINIYIRSILRVRVIKSTSISVIKKGFQDIQKKKVSYDILNQLDLRQSDTIFQIKVLIINVLIAVTRIAATSFNQFRVIAAAIIRNTKRLQAGKKLSKSTKT